MPGKSVSSDSLFLTGESFGYGKALGRADRKDKLKHCIF